jgi:hypothetical protein
MKEDEMDKTCSTHCIDEKCNKIVVVKPERKRRIGKPRHRWKNNNEIDLKEIAHEDVNWIHISQNRDRFLAALNTEMKLRGP